MALRVKTVWFKKADAQRPAGEVASVLASTIWRLADNSVTGLSKSDYDIITPDRGLRIIGEMAAFLVHMSDRMVYGRIPDADSVSPRSSRKTSGRSSATTVSTIRRTSSTC